MNQPLTAVISKEWKNRMRLIALMLAGVGCWFLFDGLVAYPKSNIRAALHAKLEAQHGADTPELEQAWSEAVQSRGWEPTPPKKVYSAGSIRTQVLLGLAALLGAAVCVWYYLKSLKETLRLEDGNLLLTGGRVIPVATIRSVNKKRWDNKGIADLTCEPAPGKIAKFILDDYKFLGTAEILKEIEKAMAPEETDTKGNT